ncbi:MAG: DsbC family protein [Thermodesulfobacteriota bacterium]
MTSIKWLAVFCAFMLLMTGHPLRAATPEESFRRHFPGIPVDSIRPAPVKGLYEILSGGEIVYYAPGSEHIIYGEIFTKDRRNLTQERILEILSGKLRAAPLEKALKIGSGPRTVIEITDPDCSYCRQASAFLSARTDVTRHIFFFPLASHPNAPAKIRYIFCAADRTRAYEEAMTGKLDGMQFTPCEDPAAAQALAAHREIGTHIGVTGTPLFLIDGHVVGGADIPLMRQILDGKK